MSKRFLSKHKSDLDKINPEDVRGGIWGVYELAGHDLWLTQNGHGAGFWDGDWPSPYNEKFTKTAEEIGEVNLYVGDDGKLYLS